MAVRLRRFRPADAVVLQPEHPITDGSQRLCRSVAIGASSTASIESATTSLLLEP